MSLFCVFQGNCSPPEGAAWIAAIIATIGLLVNCVIASMMWRSARNNNRESLRAAENLAAKQYLYDKDMEALKRSLDLKVEKAKCGYEGALRVIF